MHISSVSSRFPTLFLFLGERKLITRYYLFSISFHHRAVFPPFQADGALQGSAGEGIDEIREQIMGVVSTAMWGEFNGAGMRIAMPKQYY